MNSIFQFIDKFKKVISIFTLLIFIVVIATLIKNKYLLSEDIRKFQAPYVFNGKIDVKIEGEKPYESKLPFVINTNKSFSIVLKLKNIGMIDDKVLSFLTKDTLIRVEIDNTIIYRNIGNNNKSKYADADMLNFVDIPKTVKNNDITIHFENTKEQKRKFVIKNVKIGQKIDTITYYFLKEDLFNILLIICMIFICFSIIITSNFFERKNKIDLYFKNMALLSTFIAIYIFSVTTMSYYIFDKYKIFLYMINYTSIMIIPIFMVRAIIARVDEKKSRYLNLIYIFAVLNLSIQHLLTLNGNQYLDMMVKYTNIINFIISIALIYTLATYKDNTKHKFKLVRFTFTPLLLGVLFSIYMNQFKGFIQLNNYIKILIFIFFILQTYEYLNIYMSDRDEKTKADMYRKLAFTDKLTGVGNRQLLSEEKNTYNKSQSNFFIILFDIDNLKYINDFCGHKYGDEIIKLLIHKLEKVFDNTYKKDLYRIGGDEFVMIYHAPKEIDINKYLDKLVEDYQLAYVGDGIKNFGVSYGCAYYDSSKHIDFEKVLHIADQNMYKQKEGKPNRGGAKQALR